MLTLWLCTSPRRDLVFCAFPLSRNELKNYKRNLLVSEGRKKRNKIYDSIFFIQFRWVLMEDAFALNLYLFK